MDGASSVLVKMRYSTPLPHGARIQTFYDEDARLITYVHILRLIFDLEHNFVVGLKLKKWEELILIHHQYCTENMRRIGNHIQTRTIECICSAALINNMIK